MDKETIIYIGGFELPDKNAAAHRVIANGKLLESLGYDVCYVGISKTEMFYNKTYYGFKSHALRYPQSIIDWFRYITTFLFYKRIIDSCDNVKAIICYNLPAVSLCQLKVYCRLLNIKIFSDCTEWYIAPKTGNIISRLIKTWDIKIRMHYLHTKLDGVIAISAYLDEYYSKKGVKTLRLPPLVDSTDLKWEISSVVKSDAIVRLTYSGSPFALSPGSEVKDRLDLIIEGLYRLQNYFKNFELTILGVDAAGFLTVFPTYKERLASLENKIIWKGRVSHELSLKILKSSDYSIFLRDKNLVTTAGFPTKFVEAITCGTPVLTNRNSNIEDYLKEGENGFWIDSTNAQTVCASLRTILEKDRTNIVSLKNEVLNDNPFDYKKFTSDFKEFIS